MIPERDLVVLAPVDATVRGGTDVGVLDRLRSVLGRADFLFPCLPADPEGLAGVMAICRGTPGSLWVNGVEAAPRWRRGGRLLFEPAPFRQWENVLSARGGREILLAPVLRRAAMADLSALAPGRRWRIESLEGGDLGEVATPPVAAGEEPGIEGLARGLAAMVAPDGDVWSFYDMADRSYRLRGWRWDTGIVLEALAGAAIRTGDDAILASARKVGDRLLASRLIHPDCPGGFPEWTDLRYFESRRDASQWVAPFNAAFIAAGLVRLAEATGRDAYFQAARDSLRLAAERGLTKAGGVSGYYFEASRTWRYLGQINDSGVLGRGMALLAGEEWAAEAAARSAGYILSKAARPDGHIARAWWDPALAASPGEPLFPEWKRHPGRVVAKIFLRGQAWALMGLTGAVKLGAGQEAAEAARRLAAYVLGVQRPDGSWLYSGLQPELGACAKTTAALALALAEWSEVSGDPSVLGAVEEALGFLDGCRRPAEVPGGLAAMPVDGSEEGCIIYFRKRPVVCAYAAALELMARLALGRQA